VLQVLGHRRGQGRPKLPPIGTKAADQGYRPRPLPTKAPDRGPLKMGGFGGTSMPPPISIAFGRDLKTNSRFLPSVPRPPTKAANQGHQPRPPKMGGFGGTVCRRPFPLHLGRFRIWPSSGTERFVCANRTVRLRKQNGSARPDRKGKKVKTVNVQQLKPYKEEEEQTDCPTTAASTTWGR
jgi:hypothetical protein